MSFKIEEVELSQGKVVYKVYEFQKDFSFLGFTTGRWIFIGSSDDADAAEDFVARKVKYPVVRNTTYYDEYGDRIINGW